MDSLRDLLIEQLLELHSVERQLAAVLPKLIESATSSGLRMALEEHLTETKNQVTRLERAFEELGEPQRRRHSTSMATLIQESLSVTTGINVTEVKDVALIGAVQKMQHNQVAAYGLVRSVAETLSLQEIAQLLQQSLDEEGNTDKKLSDLARSAINQVALSVRQ